VLFAAMKMRLLAAALITAFAAPAAAHTSYLKPTQFWSSGIVRFEGAYATTFFTPEIGLSANFAVIQPNGQDGFYDQIEVTGQAAMLRSTLHDYGTYRFTTGEQLGAVSNLVGIDGGWRPAVAGEVLPEGTPTTTLQSVTLAETYVTRGGPTRGAVDRNVGRLSIRPVTHPNQILINQPFQIQVMFDGQPLANTALVVYAAGEPETDLDRFSPTDATGTATVTLDQPGQYIIAARHRANAPAGAAAAIQSYTTTLVFDAMTTMPTIEEPPPAPERPRRRRN
jgi:Domain of unknown function (DUF4198)